MSRATYVNLKYNSNRSHTIGTSNSASHRTYIFISSSCKLKEILWQNIEHLFHILIAKSYLFSTNTAITDHSRNISRWYGLTFTCSSRFTFCYYNTIRDLSISSVSERKKFPSWTALKWKARYTISVVIRTNQLI